MRAFLCSIDKSVWDAIENSWTRLKATKSTWDKAAFATASANSKALNAIFCGVSPDEFHRISHVTVTKEAWEILETTYEGTKKVKDTKLQMLTTQFKKLKMSEDESFDSFYGKLNEVVIGKFNLGKKENSKVMRKIYDHYRGASIPRSPQLKRAKTLMRKKFKSSSVLFKLMSYLYHHKGRANLLLSRQLMREWKLKIPRMRIRLKRKWHTFQRTFTSF